MQSTMTEKEFRERLSQPYGPKGGSGVMTPVEHAVFLAREAGLEFAPEPVDLPRLIEARGNGQTYLAPFGGACYTGRAQMEATLHTAADRYNAYPGLRAAAARFLEAVKPYAGGGGKIEAAASVLEHELAKGPK